MPPVAAPVWWEDVQQEREDFAGRARRPVDEWLADDVDFAPRRRLPRRSPDAAVVLELELETRTAAEPEEEGADHPLHGAFVHAESAPGGGVSEAIDEAPALPTNTLADERFLAPPPPDGARRTVHIT